MKKLTYSQKYYRAHKKEVLARQKQQYNGRYHATWHLHKRFGITVEDYDALLAKQKGVCAICGAMPTTKLRLPVDHNHQTGMIRGLLCHKCNRAIGLFKDSPQNILSAFQYLTISSFTA